MLTFVVFVSTLAFIPGAILTVGCGLAYGMIMGLGKGLVVGTVVVFVGAALGSELSFIVGRYLMRDCVGKWLESYPLFREVDVSESTIDSSSIAFLQRIPFDVNLRFVIMVSCSSFLSSPSIPAMKGKGFRIFFLLRLSPIIPFNVLNYMAGATAITFKDYSLSLIGLLPGTILYVFVGASAGSSMEHGDEGGNGKSGGHIMMSVRISSIGEFSSYIFSFSSNCLLKERKLETIITQFHSGASFSLHPIYSISVVGIVAGVLGVVAVSCYAKKELNKIIDEEGEGDRERESDTSAAVGEDEAAERV